MRFALFELAGQDEAVQSQLKDDLLVHPLATHVRIQNLDRSEQDLNAVVISLVELEKFLNNSGAHDWANSQVFRNRLGWTLKVVFDELRIFKFS